mmetsp:Transcript_65443/g.210998  ORF Transcript_65443/g.210998 Transcript_65443/m.210998 type:complete len:365 (+) Transcript_65443:106-1200(+)
MLPALLLLLAACAAWAAAQGPLVAGIRHPPTWHKTDGVCVDSPPGWLDTRGSTCEDYEQRNWCTSSGEPGRGWLQMWGSFENFAVQNRTAAMACCACGGGELSCCPSKKRLKVQMDKASGPVRAYVQKLQDYVRGRIAAVGREEARRLEAELDTFRAKLGQYEGSMREQREEVVGAARSRFLAATKHSETLEEAARHEIVSAGYAAARGAVSHGGAEVDGGPLLRAAYLAWRAFANASESWASTKAASREAAADGWSKFSKYYHDPNTTWVAIENSLGKADRFVEESRTARREVRRSKQEANVASDLAELSQGHSTAVDTQVRMAQDRAQQATAMTKANAGKLDTLEAMVDRAEEGAKMVSEGR